jgi:hypothetical protein
MGLINEMLAIDVNINGKELIVNCEYIAAVPFDPQNLDIKPEPANIIIDKVLDSNQKVVNLDKNSLKIITRECFARINSILSGVI